MNCVPIDMLPTQGPLLPTQGPLLPTQGPLLPTQGPLLPTQGPLLEYPVMWCGGARWLELRTAATCVYNPCVSCDQGWTGTTNRPWHFLVQTAHHHYIYIYICIRGVTAHKIHGSVQYNIVVSWFGTFFDTGGGAIGYVAMLEIFLI